MELEAKIKDRWPAADQWAAGVILAAAAAGRFILLGIKPPHFDEGVNGWFVDQITFTGFYHYDPTNYHGPFHFYVLFLAQRLLGRHIWALRLPLVLVSLAAVALVIAFGRFIGRRAALWAAAAMAVSPGCVFYGRYAIHESWMMLFLMLGAWGFAGLWRFGERKYLWAIWIGITGTVLTKETYILHFAAWFLTLPCLWLVEHFSPATVPEEEPPLRFPMRDIGLAAVLALGCGSYAWIGITGAAKAAYTICFCCGLLILSIGWYLAIRRPNGSQEPFAPSQWTWRDMALCALMLIGCVLFFYSGGFMNFSGLKGLYQCFAVWAHTGKSGNGHEKVWYYWLKLFGRYEWPSAVGLLAAPLSLLPRTPRIVRALAIYGGGALAAYSIIHYKTPWCIISLIWPFLILFGWAVDAGSRRFPIGSTLLAGALLAANCGDMIWLNFFHYTDAREPYVYVQTFDDVFDLMDPLNRLVSLDPANYQVSGHILMESYHPLPWLLGDFPNIGYYDNDQKPPTSDADFLLVDDGRIEDVEDQFHDSYFTKMIRLRDAQDQSKLYLSVKKFRTIFPGRKPEFVPAPAATRAPVSSPASASRSPAPVKAK